MIFSSFQRLITIFLCLYVGVSTLTAQEQTQIPDLTGLTMPQAAAELNAVGLRLGTPTAASQVTDDVPFGTIVGQSVVAGEFILRGSPIDVRVASNARLSLVYDNNDLTLVNASGVALGLRRFQFQSADGSFTFPATRWRARDNILQAGDCLQVWSVSRRNPKSVDGCELINWLTTNNPIDHFWTQTAGVNQFALFQDGRSLGTCDAAPRNSQSVPLTCDLYIVPDQLRAPTTDYVYFAYTSDRFAVINTSDEAWMPLTETSIFNFNPQLTNPGVGLSLGNPDFFQNPTTVADTRRLAPGQCLLLTLAPLTDAEPPEPCMVLAQRSLAPSVAFWVAPFELTSPFARQERATCPAATANRLTRCIMPR